MILLGCIAAVLAVWAVGYVVWSFWDIRRNLRRAAKRAATLPEPAIDIRRPQLAVVRQCQDCGTALEVHPAIALLCCPSCNEKRWRASEIADEERERREGWRQ